MRSSGDLAQSLSWHSLAVVKGAYSAEDCTNDVAEIKFDRPVPIKVIFVSVPSVFISNS